MSLSPVPPTLRPSTPSRARRCRRPSSSNSPKRYTMMQRYRVPVLIDARQGPRHRVRLKPHATPLFLAGDCVFQRRCVLLPPSSLTPSHALCFIQLTFSTILPPHRHLQQAAQVSSCHTITQPSPPETPQSPAQIRRPCLNLKLPLYPHRLTPAISAGRHASQTARAR